MKNENKNVIVIQSKVSENVDRLLADANVPQWIRDLIGQNLTSWEDEQLPRDKPPGLQEVLTTNLENGKIVIRFDKTKEREGKIELTPQSAQGLVDVIQYWLSKHRFGGGLWGNSTSM